MITTCYKINILHYPCFAFHTGLQSESNQKPLLPTSLSRNLDNLKYFPSRRKINIFTITSVNWNGRWVLGYPGCFFVSSLLFPGKKTNPMADEFLWPYPPPLPSPPLPNSRHPSTFIGSVKGKKRMGENLKITAGNSG